MTDTRHSTLWYTRCPVPSPLGIAAQHGWLDQAFSPLGLAVRSVRDDPDPQVRDSHFSHHLPWSFRQGGNIPALWARSRHVAGEGAATRLVALTWTDEFQAVITLPGHGRVNAGDLAGARIGIPRNDAARIDFQRATSLKGVVSGLAIGNLALKDVQLIELPTAPRADQPAGSLFGLRRRQPYSFEAAALLRGEIDAFFVKGAEGVQVANALGAIALADVGRHPDPKIRVNNGTPRTLTVDQGLLDDRPDLAQQLLHQVLRADAWARSHPADALRYVAREIVVSEEAVVASNGADVHLHLSLALQPAWLDALSHFKDFLLTHGFLPADFDLAEWADGGPLATAQAVPLAA